MQRFANFPILRMVNWEPPLVADYNLHCCNHTIGRRFIQIGRFLLFGSFYEQPNLMLDLERNLHQHWYCLSMCFKLRLAYSLFFEYGWLGPHRKLYALRGSQRAYPDCPSLYWHCLSVDMPGYRHKSDRVRRQCLQITIFRLFHYSLLFLRQYQEQQEPALGSFISTKVALLNILIADMTMARLHKFKYANELKNLPSK